MKTLNEYIKEEKQTTGSGCVEMVKSMIDHLKENPDYKSKDKELWDSAAYFLYDYLKELKNNDYEKIIKELDLPDLRNSDKDEFSAASVQAAVALKLTDK